MKPRDFFFALAKGSSLMAVGWLGFRLVDVVGLDVTRRTAAEQEVDRWGEENRLLLSRFPEREIERLRGTLEWSPLGTAMRGNGSDRTI